MTDYKDGVIEQPMALLPLRGESIMVKCDYCPNMAYKKCEDCNRFCCEFHLFPKERLCFKCIQELLK